MKLRIKFSKHGALKYIGHLDVMRYFQKCMRRAEIDIAYSTGYSPHQLMTFAQPLGVGLESDGEYMDIVVNSYESLEDVKDRLNNAGVKEIRILNVVELPENAGNAMASVAGARYFIRFREGRVPSFMQKDEGEIVKLFEDFLSRDEIIVEREGKAGIRQINIREGIYELKYVDGGVEMLVNASSAGNVKATDVMNTLADFAGEAYAENALMITRMDTYTFADQAETDYHKLIPMDMV